MACTYLRSYIVASRIRIQAIEVRGKLKGSNLEISSLEPGQIEGSSSGGSVFLIVDVGGHTLAMSHLWDVASESLFVDGTIAE